LNLNIEGEIPTIAAWIRNFVLKHPRYQKDSIVTKVKRKKEYFELNSIGNCL